VVHCASTAALTAVLLWSGCSQPPEPQRGGVPPDLSINVEIDGRPLAPIDARSLAAAPDIEDQHRLAWRLERLIPQLADAKQLVVEKSDGQRVVLPLGDGGQPVSEIALLLNLKGEVVLASLDPSNPFPAFHGRGGNRGRAPGEDRIRDPHWLRLRSRPSGRPAEPTDDASERIRDDPSAAGSNPS
jgi:hypothetical protein